MKQLQELLSSWFTVLVLSSSLPNIQCIIVVCQSAAPGKCVLLSTSRTFRDEMPDWTLSQDVAKWPAKLDVRELEVPLILSLRRWAPTLAAKIKSVLRNIHVLGALPLSF